MFYIFKVQIRYNNIQKPYFLGCISALLSGLGIAVLSGSSFQKPELFNYLYSLGQNPYIRVSFGIVF